MNYRPDPAILELGPDFFDAVEPAAERGKAGGGQIANGPMEVPGGSWIVQCKDPQGATFALVGPRSR